MPIAEVIALVGVGLLSGVLGGMLGIGGSIIIIPALTLFIHIQGVPVNQHLAQAAAMIVNVFVAVPSTLHHARENAVDWKAAGRMLPFGIVFIIIGVEVSNVFEGRILMGVFAVFLLYVVVNNILKMAKLGANVEDDAPATRGWWRIGFVGSLVGFASGLLGIGGGTLMVPLFQRVVRFPLRRAIATSAAVMCITAIFGAIRKNWTLAELHEPGVTVEDSFLLAACLAPTAFFGGLIGAKLTHALPIKWVRLAFIALLTVASARMLWAAAGG